MEHPFVCNVWSHMNDPFSEPFKDVFINKFWKNNSVWIIPLLSKNKSALELSLVEESSQCSTPYFASWSQDRIIKSTITRLKRSCSLAIPSRRSKHFFSSVLLFNREVFRHHFVTDFRMCKSCVKI